MTARGDQTPAVGPSAPSPSPAPDPDPAAHRRPGWLEVAVAAPVYGVLIAAGIWWIWSIPTTASATAGIVEFVVSGLAGLGAFAAAFAARIRVLPVFGLRRVPLRWLALGAGLGVGVYLLNIAVAFVAVHLTGAGNPQGDYRSAASGSLLTLVVTILAGALLTPVGEELLFRGVLANALGRYSPWVSVLVSAGVFALAHGLNVILPIAFTVGVVNALLLRKTGSIWPGVCVHAMNNFLPLLLAAAATTAR